MERIVRGKFKLGRKIGSGSFGEIFIAQYLRFRGPYSSDSCPDFSALASLVAFLEGMFAGSLRLDLNKDPLKEWVARAVEASATTDEEISSRKDAQAE